MYKILFITLLSILKSQQCFSSVLNEDICMDERTYVCFEKKLINYTSNTSLDDLKQRTFSTLGSFWYLYKNAEQLSALPQAMPSILNEKFSYILNHQEEFEDPDCPELEILGIQPSPEMKLYQKVNRYLFEDLDNEIKAQFDFQNLSQTSFPFPVIEWTVNLLEDFEFESLKSCTDNSFETTLLSHFTKYYSRGILKKYLQLGWSLLTQRFSEIDQAESNLQKLETEFLTRLKCSMCYPARVSVLMSPLNPKLIKN